MHTSHRYEVKTAIVMIGIYVDTCSFCVSTLLLPDVILFMKIRLSNEIMCKHGVDMSRLTENAEY